MDADIIVVDEHDNIIGHKKRSEITENDIYRASGLWITNSKGDILLAKRSEKKVHGPGLWAAAVAGTNDKGETYRQNIIKEAEEEIGLKNIDPIEGPKQRIADDRNYFGQWFTLTIDKPIEEFTLDNEEVEDLRWFTKEELLVAIEKNPELFSKRMKDWITQFSS